MPQWAVHRLGDTNMVLDIQSDMIGAAGTRIVIPLVPKDDLPNVDRRLLPVVLAGDVALHALTLGVTAVPTAALGPALMNAAGAREDVTRALDMVLGGV